VESRRTSFDVPLLQERRRALERFYADFAKGVERLRLSPATTNVKQAQEWLRRGP